MNIRSASTATAWYMLVSFLVFFTLATTKWFAQVYNCILRSYEDTVLVTLLSIEAQTVVKYPHALNGTWRAHTHCSNGVYHRISIRKYATRLLDWIRFSAITNLNPNLGTQDNDTLVHGYIVAPPASCCCIMVVCIRMKPYLMNAFNSGSSFAMTSNYSESVHHIIPTDNQINNNFMAQLRHITISQMMSSTYEILRSREEMPLLQKIAHTYWFCSRPIHRK